MPHPPAAMSPEAEAFLEQGDPASFKSGTDMTIQEMREATLEAYRPSVEAAVAKLGVETNTIEIAGVSCLEVLPPKRRDGAQILYLFGGGFMLGSPFEDLPISASIAVQTGAHIVSPTYSLAPENPYPAALDEIAAVAEYLLSETTDTLLCGESAGGNLALALVHRLRAAAKPAPRALALMSPATDLANRGDSAEADRDPFLRAERIPEVRAAYVADSDPTNPEISPIYGSFDPDFPPTLVTTGTRDMLLSGCVRLARVMRERGAPIDLRVWEGMWHVFEFYPGIPEAKASLKEISEFLSSHM